MIATLQAKKENDKHLLTATTSGTIRRKQHRRHVSSASRNVSAPAQEADKIDEPRTLTLVSNEELGISTGESSNALEEGCADDLPILYLWTGADTLGRNVVVLRNSRYDLNSGEKFLASLFGRRRNDEKDKPESEIALQRNRKDKEDSVGRIEELP